MMKFELRCSVRQSDGRILRFVRWFDSLLDVHRFIYQFRISLCEDWHIIQHNDYYSEREQHIYIKPKIDAYEQDLPF